MLIDRRDIVLRICGVDTSPGRLVLRARGTPSAAETGEELAPPYRRIIIVEWTNRRQTIGTWPAASDGVVAAARSVFVAVYRDDRLAGSGRKRSS